MYKYIWYCRWCGGTYKPKKETDRDGFCPGGKCKQAHHRAYNKYVTGRSGPCDQPVKKERSKKGSRIKAIACEIIGDRKSRRSLAR